MFATYCRTQMKNIMTRIYHRYIQNLIRSERFSQRGDSCNSRKNFLEANKSWFTMFFFYILQFGLVVFRKTNTNSKGSLSFGKVLIISILCMLYVNCVCCYCMT